VGWAASRTARDAFFLNPLRCRGRDRLSRSSLDTAPSPDVLTDLIRLSSTPGCGVMLRRGRWVWRRLPASGADRVALAPLDTSRPLVSAHPASQLLIHASALASRLPFLEPGTKAQCAPSLVGPLSGGRAASRTPLREGAYARRDPARAQGYAAFSPPPSRSFGRGPQGARPARRLQTSRRLTDREPSDHNESLPP
jgi:hypothetical protein